MAFKTHLALGKAVAPALDPFLIYSFMFSTPPPRTWYYSLFALCCALSLYFLSKRYIVGSGWPRSPPSHCVFEDKTKKMFAVEDECSFYLCPLTVRRTRASSPREKNEKNEIRLIYAIAAVCVFNPRGNSESLRNEIHKYERIPGDVCRRGPTVPLCDLRVR